MSTLVIKNLPDDLHARLRDQAERNRRSVTQEAISLIHVGLVASRAAPPLAPPIRLKGGPITTHEIETAIDEGRE
jgi:plasmid stability protein